MPKGPETFPPVAVSSISATPTDIHKPWQIRFASRGIAKNTATIIQELETAFGSSAGVFLVPGRNINEKRIARKLKERNVKTFGIDIPDVVPVKHLWNELRNPEKRKGRIKNHLGWYISNVGSERQQRRKVRKALDATGTTIVKANTSLWLGDLQKNGVRENPRGKKVEEMLAKRGNITLAIEIDKALQTPEEYLAFVKQKKHELKDTIHVGLDIDLGHIAETGANPIDFLKRVYSDEELHNSVIMVSFNQHMKGELEAHASLNAEGGAVNFPAAAQEMGRRSSQAIVLFELHPKDNGFFATGEGIAFATNLKNFYTHGITNR